MRAPTSRSPHMVLLFLALRRLTLCQPPALAVAWCQPPGSGGWPVCAGAGVAPSSRDGHEELLGQNYKSQSYARLRFPAVFNLRVVTTTQRHTDRFPLTPRKLRQLHAALGLVKGCLWVRGSCLIRFDLVPSVTCRHGGAKTAHYVIS